MVNSQYIIHGKGIPEAAHPPVKACIPVIVPLVQWVAPQLAGSRKSIWRAACHSYGPALIIQLEQLRMSPGVCTVHGYIDRNISNDFHALAVGIAFQCVPLAGEIILHELLELYIKIQLTAIVVHGIAPAEADILRPFIPALALKAIL